MNNISQKNIIFENSRNNGLPYYNAGSIQYVGGQNINFATLNNTFQQLIDNDLYDENYIRNYAEHVVGPKPSDSAAVYAGSEGYKAFSDDGVQMHIYRKHENPLSSSVSCVLPGVCANFVAQTGQYVIAGCDDGIYFEQNGFHRLADDKPAYGKYFSDYANLIASDDGVYSLIMKPGYDISQYHLFVKLNANDIGVCRSVFYIDETHTVVVGTDDGIYEGACYSYMLGREDVSCTVVFSKMKMLDGTQPVSVAINALTASGAAPIAATSNGLFKPDKIYDFTGYGGVLDGRDIRFRLDDGEKWIIGADDGIYSVPYSYDGSISKFIDLADPVAAVQAKTGAYFATSSNIFRYINGQLKTLVTGLNGINSIQVYASVVGDFPIFSDGSTVYYMGNDSDYGELAVFDDAHVNDIYINKHELFVATTAGLYKYRLYAGNIEYDSENIVSSDRVYQATVDDDFGPNGLIELNGNLYAYSGKGVRGLTNPSDFVDVSADHCCVFEGDNGQSLFVVSSGKDAYVFDDKLFKQSHIRTETDIQDIKATSNMVLFRLADKTLWQIHKKGILAIKPELTRIYAYSGIDDFTTYNEFAAVRQGTALKFLQEYTRPEKLGVLSGMPVNGLQYNQTFNIIFASTTYGLSAIDMSVIDPATSSYVVQQIYSGNTYGCWSSRDKLYNFALSGVDVYDIVKTASPESESGETATRYVYRHTVLKRQNKIINGMCELDGRQLYATNDGLYASVLSTSYDRVTAWPDDIRFCYKTTLSVEQTDSVEDLFICYDSGGKLFRYFNGIGDGDRDIQNFAADLSVTGCAASNYDDNLLYIATSTSGLYAYNKHTNELSRCDAMPISANIVGISNVRYNIAGDSEVIAACVYNAENAENIKNKIFVETGINVFSELTVSQNIIDYNRNDELVHVEFMPIDGINSAQLFIHMKAHPASGEENKVKVVSVLRQGALADDCDVSAMLDVGYDRVCASSDRFVYMTRKLGPDSVKTYVYSADAADSYEERVAEIPEADLIFKDVRGSVYVRRGGQYYKTIGGALERLLISDSEFSDKIIGLEYYDLQSGYAIIKNAGSDIGGIYRVSPDNTQVVPVRTNFENKQLYSIYNAFGLIITSYNNKLYWSDVEHVEDLADSRNYNEVSSVSRHFIGCCVSEETNTVYAYGTKFIVSWHASNKSTFISNAGNYTLETYDNFAEFAIKKVIPHESYVVDLYLKNSVGYVKPYVLPGDGVYVYNPDNVQMLIKPSALAYAAKLFQIPDGISYMAGAGVMYTTNCENAEQFSVRGAALTVQTQDIKYDGKTYYVRIGGKWHYVYHGRLTLVPDTGEITDILYHADSAVRVQDGKFFRFEYAKMKRVTAEEIEHAVDGRDVLRIFIHENGLYYKVQSAGGFQLVDERYAPVRMYFADHSGMQVFEDVCLARTGGLILIQAAGGVYYCGHFDEVAQKYDVQGIGFPTDVYVKNGFTGFDSREGIIKFNRYGIVNVYRRIDDSPVNFTKILGIGDADYLICSSEGLYRYIQDFVYKMSGEKAAAGCIYMDMFEDEPGYVTSNDSGIYRSSDLVDWRFLFSSGVVGDIRDIYVKSLNDYYVATSAGVVKTIYSYELINDIEQRNEYELQAVVDSLAGDLDSAFDNQLDDHLTKWHSPQSQMYFINGMMLSVDMSGISEDWQNVETGNELVIENDLVDTMQFGDLSAFGCEIGTENPIFSQQFAPAEYVFKRYMSGVSELLVHVQTTKTYYLNGVPGSPVPNEEQEVISRKNLESITELEPAKKKQNSSVPEHATKITLKVPKSVANISEVHDVQICPSSLPLKIYSDNIDANDAEKNGIFNSKVVPSIALPYEIDESGATFSFRCFGTDEQSIRIQFTEIKNSSNGSAVIEFYPNGGEGTMPVQRIPIGVQTNLNKVGFANVGKFFLGWSFQPQADGHRPTYIDGQQVVLSPDEYSDGDTVRLYAVWTAQNIESDANIFGIESDGTTLYVKDAVEVVPGQTIIDYGDGDDIYIPSDDMPEEPQSDPEPDPEIEQNGDYLTDEDMLPTLEIDDYQQVINDIDGGELNDGSLLV